MSLSLPRLVAAASAFVLALAGARSARAADTDEPRLRWDDEWPRFRPAEYAVTGVLGPAALLEYTYLPGQKQPHWLGGVLFDDGVRNALRVRSPSGLQTVRTLSDAVSVGVITLTVGVDSLLVPLLRGSSDVALQGTAIDVEAFSISSIVVISLYDTVGRTRPSYFDCQRDPSFDPMCSNSPSDSFPSGHVDEVFTAAGLSCANHLYLRLYGRRWADALACARDLTLATTGGVLRIMGDRHYATDVLAGAAMGFGFGYGLPVLLHFGARRNDDRTLSLAPMTGGRLGLVAVGRF